MWERQGWSDYHSGTRPVQNDKHEYTKALYRFSITRTRMFSTHLNRGDRSIPK